MSLSVSDQQPVEWNVRRAAVLGAGTMGARIAAHLANCGVPVYLLDIIPKEPSAEEKKKGFDLNSPLVRNRTARQGLEAATKGKPAAFYADDKAALITIGNFEDNLPWLAEADWIIEAVAENLEIKRALWRRVARFRKPGAIASTNTSGLSIAKIAEVLPEEMRQHFLGAHFFNPPRYLHLVELIPSPETRPEVVAAVEHYVDVRLGKGVVRAKDTPDFIANRIGTFCICCALQAMCEEGLAIAEVDQLMRVALGWPRSALFGTLDLVGLDIVADVIDTLQEHATSDERRSLFRIPDFMDKMIKQGMLGQKSGSGFYKRPAKGEDEMLALDLNTMSYRALKKVELPALEGAKAAKNGSDRLRRILQSEDKAGRFVWKLLSETWCYAARRIPEIADRIVDIDRAMCWGWGWESGPFELWDSAGLAGTVQRLEAGGGVVPESIKRMLAGGKTRFYDDAAEPRYYDLMRGEYAPEPRAPGLVLLRRGSPTPPVIEQNAAASLLDLGDGVLCAEFHSKLNTVGPDTIAMVNRGFDELNRNFDAMVIGNQGAVFSAGADLALLLRYAQAGQFNEIDKIIHDFQQMNLLIEYSPKPIVVAPFGQTLGGGCEMTLASRRAQAYAETRIGLVETAVGLIPAAGGVKEMLLRTSDAAGPHGDLLPGVRTLFQNISMARASSCADEAVHLGYLRPSDGITINPDRLLADAKTAALEMARQGYRPLHPGPRSDLRVLGQAGAAELKINIHLARQGNYISEYDAHIAGKLAHVLCGGAITAPSMVSEQYLLDLEREAFVSLCGEPLTQARIQHTLKTGKPLRN